ncbi:phage tail assembly chaperone G, partial [Bacillus cereus group sp. Bce025]
EAVAVINAIDSKTNSAKKKRQRNRKNRSNQQK